MAKRFAGLKSFGSKAVSVLASSALALSLTPAIALAAPADLQAQSVNLSAQHYDPDNASGLAMLGSDRHTDPLDGGIVEVSRTANTLQYMGYAHSDGSHYQGYSLYTKMTVDDNGVLTGVDITSGNDTFAGKWGYRQAKTAQKGNPETSIEFYLPDGVSFNAVHKGDGIYQPVLTGTSEYAYTKANRQGKAVNYPEGYDTSSSPAVTLIHTGDGTDADPYVETAWAGDKAAIDTKKYATSGEGENAVTTVEDADYYNLVKCTYSIGYESVAFNTYFPAGKNGDAAASYIDQYIEPNTTTWSDNPTEGYTTNRDGWTAIMGTMILRELASWGAHLSNPVLSTGVDGEIATIDTVSGATKTSVPFVAALNKAQETGFIKGVSENVQVTIDGANAQDAAALPGLTINKAADGSDAFQDAITVTKGEDGLYTISGTFKPYGGGRLSLDGITLYDLNGVKLGAQGVMALSKELPTADNQFQQYVKEQLIPYSLDDEGNYTSTTTFFAADDESHLISFGARASEPTNEYTVTVGQGANAKKYTKSLESDAFDFTYTKVDDATMSFTIKVTDPSVTHLAMTYTLGHGRVTPVYDLANQAKVADVSKTLAAASASNASSVTAARTAYDALPYDVRPFTTGISNLHTAEAALVTAQLNGVSASNEAGVSAARTAYDKLDAAAKAQVESAAYSKLTAAEKSIADAKAAAEKAAADKAAADKAAAEAAAAAKVVKKGDTKTVSGQTYKVTKVATSKAQGTVTFTKAKNAKSVTVPATVKLNDDKTYKVTQVAAGSFTASKIRTVTIGTNVTKIAPQAFKGSKATKAVVKTTSLKKANVKNCFKGSKVTTVKVPAKKLTAYKKIFTKKITGASKTLKVTK